MSNPTEPSDLATHQQGNFKQQLEDVIEKLQITSDLTISYRDREPVTIASHLQEYLKQISSVDRNQYLAAKLQKYLYSIFSFDVQPEESSSLDRHNAEAKNLGDRQETANYVNKWSRTKFYQQLVQSNHGEGYNDPNWLVVKQEANYWHVIKNDLTLHIKPEKHLVEPIDRLQPGQLVTIKMPSNLVERGFYIAVGNSGPIEAAKSSDDIITQMYFNLSSQGAVQLLDNLTQELNAITIPFDLRVAYDETQFDDLDAVVLNFKSSDFELVYPIVKTAINNLKQKNQHYVRSKIPFFCQPLSPGWGLAEKPRSPSFKQENIGQHYCGIIAKALIERWQQNGLTGNKLADVFNYLSLAGVDIEYLYLNPNPTKSHQVEIDQRLKHLNTSVKMHFAL